MHARGWTHAAGVAVLVGLLAAACATTEPTPTPTPVVEPPTAPSVDPSLTPPEGASLARVSATGSSTCIVREDGTLACWGTGAPDPPAGTFRTVSTGFTGSCGIRGDGSLTCWASGSESIGVPPEGAFLSVSAGSYTACGIRVDETLVCWAGGGEEGLTSQPGLFRDVSLAPGSGTACAVRDDGSLTCWSVDGMEEEPGREDPGPFAAVSIADGFGCAVREDGRLTCWGEGIEPEERHGEADPPDGRFRDVATGATHACALADDGAITCWGDDREGQASPPAGSFVTLSAGSRHTCAQRADGAVTCWGSDADGRVSLEAGAARTADAVPVRAAAVSAGNQQTCILAPDGSLACWGESAAQPMTGHFVALSAGDSMACAIDVAGRIHCSNDSVAVLPDGRFLDVDAKEGACAVRDDGQMVCWGMFSEDMMRPPDGRFTKVSLGFGQACGLLRDGQVRCWTEDASSPARSLAGTFSDIALGDLLCGIRLADSAVVCSGGEEGVPNLDPPDGSFLTIDAGARFCALRTDHTVSCWGGFEEEATVKPPGGTFVAIDAGGGHDCGIRTDGRLECWGIDRPAITPRIQALVQADIAHREGRSFPVTWSASSPFGQIVSYDVQYVAVEPGGRSGAPSQWQTDTRATTGRLRGEPGINYCFSVRARDARGVVSDWIPGGCANLPLDDRVLHRSAGWRLRNGDAYYESTATTSSRRGATLTMELDPSVGVSIVATTCPTCGTIRVSIEGMETEEEGGAPEPVTISLRSPTRLNGQLLPGLVDDEGLAGTLRIEVVSDDGQVIIDGVQVWTD